MEIHERFPLWPQPDTNINYIVDGKHLNIPGCTAYISSGMLCFCAHCNQTDSKGNYFFNLSLAGNSSNYKTTAC